MSLSENLKYWQSLRNMTTNALAAKANIPPDTISKIRGGITRNPTMETLQRLAQALECSVDDLVDVAPVSVADVRELLPKKIPTDPEELANIICISLRNQRMANDRTVAELRKDRNTWRKIALTAIACLVPMMIAMLITLGLFYWDMSHPTAGRILYDSIISLQ